MTSSIKPEVHNVSLRRAMAIGGMHKKFGEDRTCNSEDIIAGGRTNTSTQTRSSQYFAALSGAEYKNLKHVRIAEASYMMTAESHSKIFFEKLLLFQRHVLTSVLTISFVHIKVK